MAFFDKLLGKGDDAPKKGSDQRVHERFPANGERVTMLRDGRATQHAFDLQDMSEGGFCLKGYDGEMKAGQYFEFRLTGAPDRGAPEADGFATVVRGFGEDKLACKFPPQPRLKKFMRDYLGL